MHASLAEVAYKKVKPGVSVQTDDMIEGTLVMLLNWSKLKVPSHFHSQTHIFWKATAGMRLLSDNDQQR